MVNLPFISFWKRKQATSAPETQRIIPLPTLPSSNLETPRSTSVEAANRARETLKVLRLEKQILGTALTTIYESHTKGLITEAERDRLLEKYKVDLSGLEKSIQDNQRLVDLFDLESEREELTKNYRTRLSEIEDQLKTLKSGGSVTRSQTQESSQGKSPPASDQETKRTQSERAESHVEQKTSDTDQQEVTDAEKRIEKIREEILQAMDRLEQIEAEG